YTLEPSLKGFRLDLTTLLERCIGHDVEVCTFVKTDNLYAASALKIVQELVPTRVVKVTGRQLERSEWNAFKGFLGAVTRGYCPNWYAPLQVTNDIRAVNYDDYKCPPAPEDDA